jgi:hypothetical protein
VAAIHGTGGGSAVGMARGEGGAPFMGGQEACKRPQGTTATSMGARAGLGGSEQQGRQARNGPVVRRRSRPDGARREEGADSEAALGRAWLRGTSLGRRERARTSRRRTVRWSAGDVAPVLKLFRTGPVRAIKAQFFATKVHQGVNRKVVDLTTLYNF